MILTFYGKGKGKTSAALGLALRASGHGKKVLFCQFIKGDWKTGEDEALKKVKGITHKKCGIGFVLPSDSEKKRQEHKRANNDGLKFIDKNLAKYDLVVLDEVLYAIKLRLLDIDEVIAVVKKSKKTDFVLTGRYRFKKIIDVSDLVSEIIKVKHPFDSGKKAKKGIDW